jgi:hypothetical protein
MKDAMEFIGKLPQYKAAAEQAVKEFPPEFLLRSATAKLKRWVLETLAGEIDIPALSARLGETEERTRELLTATWEAMQKK